ncbi:MAG: NTP transferase domain-containing protein [Methanomassiliicoccales archaeon]|nr:MAG: NTP transferase domain-containing protein [Methanomassiliicoccales archaeon]
MKAVILAAGEGTRLRPFTVSKPKVMIPIANRPIIEYAVDALSQNGIKDIVIVVGYKKERIMSHFEDGKKFGVDIKYVFQPKPLGTAHALLQAQEDITSDFLVLPGDNLIDLKEVSKLMESEGENSLLIAESDIPSKYGVVFLEKGNITKILEKPPEKLSNLISTGIYRFTPGVFDSISVMGEEGKHALSAVVQFMIEKGHKISGIRGVGKWIDAVYPWDILDVNASAITDAKIGVAGNIEEGAIIKGQVSIGDGSVIRSGSYIVGPVVIGKGCEIGPNVCIYPSTSIGDNVSIQPFCMVKHSVLMNDVQIGSSSTISNSVIGDGVRIGSHFTTNNDEALVQIESGYHSVANIGAIIGEDSDIGDLVNVRPGMIMGARCKVSSSIVLEGSLPNRSIVM